MRIERATRRKTGPLIDTDSHEFQGGEKNGRERSQKMQYSEGIHSLGKLSDEGWKTHKPEGHPADSEDWYGSDEEKNGEVREEDALSRAKAGPLWFSA